MAFQIGSPSQNYDCDIDDCRAVVKKGIEVKTPVKVDVRTTSGDAKIICAKPRITATETHTGQCASRCEFTVSQKICVEIPISYRVRTDVKDSHVNCDVDCSPYC